MMSARTLRNYGLAERLLGTMMGIAGAFALYALILQPLTRQ